MSDFGKFFGKSLGSALGSIPSSIIGTGIQFFGNKLFNSQQEDSSKRLMEFQNKLNRENTYLQPILQRQGQRDAGISPAFADGPSQSVASPNVPLPSTGNDVHYNPLMFQQIKGMELQNEEQEIKNSHYEEQILSEIQSNTANALLANSDALLKANENEKYQLLKQFVGGESSYGQLLADNMFAELDNLLNENLYKQAETSRSRAGKNLIDKQISETEEKIKKVIKDVQQMDAYLALATRSVLANEKQSNASLINAGANAQNAETLENHYLLDKNNSVYENRVREATIENLHKQGFVFDAEKQRILIGNEWIPAEKVANIIISGITAGAISFAGVSHGVKAVSDVKGLVTKRRPVGFN